MSANLFVNEREFTETLRKAAAATSRTLGSFMNSRAYYLGKRAMDHTPIASREKISADLGAELKSEKVDKKGKLRRRYSYSPKPVVFGIINARRRKAGEAALTGQGMATAAKKLISGRLRAVGSLKSGFVRGLAKLAAAAHLSFSKSGPNVKMVGEASPAKEGFSPTASFTYRVTVGNGAGRHVDPRVESATQTAFAEDKAELIRHLESKMKDTLKKAGAL